MKFILVNLACALMVAHAYAGKVEIIDAKAKATGPGEYRFSVTLRHADTGWEHYADGWEVLAPDGTPLAKRVLYHPHINEQPFTRDLSGVKIPRSLNKVMIRAQDNQHGHSKKNWTINLK